MWNVSQCCTYSPEEKRNVVILLHSKQMHTHTGLCLIVLLEPSSNLLPFLMSVDSHQCSFCFDKLKGNISKTECREGVSLLTHLICTCCDSMRHVRDACAWDVLPPVSKGKPPKCS